MSDSTLSAGFRGWVARAKHHIAVEISRQNKVAAERAARKKAEAARLAREAEAQAAERAEQKKQELARREARIRAWYADRLNIKDYETRDIVRSESIRSGDKWVDCKMTLKFTLSRALSSMPDREVDILRYLDLFGNYEMVDNETYNTVTLALIYNEGDCSTKIEHYSIARGFANHFGIRNQTDGVRYIVGGWGGTSKAAGITLFLTRFSQIENEFPDHHLVREFKKRVLRGQNWLAEHDVGSSMFSGEGPAPILLGATEDGQRVRYAGEGSLVTIAPPGSGKTQCHVYTNLLSYRGPMVVLDVKGECYRDTAEWREKNVGPVVRFNPLETEASAGKRYNPLERIDVNRETIWEDCKSLAELLIVPKSLGEPSWEDRARNIVTGVIAWILLGGELDGKPCERSMSTVVKIVSYVGWNQFVTSAQEMTDIEPLRNLGESLAKIHSKQLSGDLSAAQRHLSVWEGSRIKRATAACDWTPEVLCDGSNTTVYICIPVGEIEANAQLLRIIFAQHLKHLMRGTPDRRRTPILFLMDELPQLGFMKPVETALEVGRSYGIRLWMFAQNLGQFRKTYEQADGMIGNCAVRIYMNPGLQDETAQKLSEELGRAESIIDGSKNPMVEATELAGPDWRDWQLVFGRNTRPLKLKKIFAFQDAEFSPRLTKS